MFIDQSDLDPASSVPLYRQLFNVLVDRIDHGDLEGGDPLPTEELLCRTLHLSRATVHRAYDLLVQENCVDRRPGAGTFVRPRRLRLDPALGTRQQLQLAQARCDHRCELLGIEKAPPTAIQQDRLGIDSASPIWLITRLHHLDGHPRIVERSCMACARVPSLDVDQAAGSLAQVLHRSGSGPLHAREVLGAVALASADAALLDVKPGQPAFRLEREVFDEQGRCWEYGLRSMCGHDLRFDILTAEKGDDPFCY